MLGFESPDPFFFLSQQAVRVSQPRRRVKVTRDSYSLNLLAKLLVLHRQILFSLATAAIAEAILMRTSAEQVPSLHRVCLLYTSPSPRDLGQSRMPSSA